MTDVKATLQAELVALGIAPHEARWLIDEFVLGQDPAAATALRLAAKRRLDGEPLQYIIGHWPFRGLDLDVDPRVLIPRPETEELVDVALDALATMSVSAPTIMDLGCGSGAIGLALLQELRERGLHATLIAVDASADALAVAKRNAIKHKVLAASFVASTWFDAVDPTLAGHLDLIVSNPPYISAHDFASLDPVLHHEPTMALVAPDAQGVGGFSDLATIIDAAPQWLTPRGVLICEHGFDQSEAARDAARRAGFSDVTTRRDLAGHERILVAKR